jgi:hypothetical protein
MEWVSNSWAPATAYIGLTSLAQGDGDAHQECKWHWNICFAFSRARFRQLRKSRSRYLAIFTVWIDVVDRDFHGFLWSITFVLWIRLERSSSLVLSAAFLTRSTDSGSASSQPVHGESPVFIAVRTISADSTGIGYYYCIYINISLYILRRSKRRAVGECKKRDQLKPWSYEAS